MKLYNDWRIKVTVISGNISSSQKLWSFRFNLCRRWNITMINNQNFVLLSYVTLWQISFITDFLLCIFRNFHFTKEKLIKHADLCLTVSSRTAGSVIKLQACQGYNKNQVGALIAKPICDSPPQIASKVCFNFLNKISFTRPDSSSRRTIAAT